MTGILQRLLAVYLLVCPTVLFALGLGDIRLHSALNEPLSAEIELLGAAPDELNSLRAGLASREAFSRYGVEQSSQLNSLEFKVGRSNDGRDVLRVTSREAIADPFLTFLIEVNWSRGRLLREYTLLLDPPVYLPQGDGPGEQSSGTAVSAPEAQPSTQTEDNRSGAIQRPAETPAQSSTSSSETTSAPASRPSAAAADGTYKVRPNDTLWRIASTLQPGSPREVNRMMVALYRANPEAFDGNINELRAGAILRVPDSTVVESVAAGEAGAEVRRQYSEWRASRGIAPSETAGESARLRLVTPTERGDGAAATSAPSASSATADSKVRELESQLTESRRLLQLKEAELARLQQQLGQQTAPPAALPPPEAAQPEAAAPAPETEVPPAETAPETAQPPVTEQATPPAETPPPAAQTPPAAEPPATSEGSIVDWLIANWYFPLAALLLIVGGIFFALRKRGEPDFDTLGRLAAAGADSIEREPPMAREPITARLRTPKQEENSFLVEESGEHEQPPQFKPTAKAEPARAPRMAEPAPVAAEKTADDTLSSETAINLDQGDPLAEADFHMAYGLYDQAADLVRIAIEREPQRRDLRLKLLEIFFVWGNKDAFLQAARQLNDTRDQAPAGEWDKIVIMGKQIAPEDALFARASSSTAATGIVDLSLESGENRMDLDLLGGMSNDRGSKSDSIDLDLGGALGQDDTSDTGESPALKEDTGLDFILDDSAQGEDHSGGTTREMAARTQESPTIESETWRPGPDSPTVESPMLRDRASSTIKEKVDSALFRKDSISSDQTAELALDDLGLDLDGLPGAENESLDSLEDTAHPRDELEETDHPSTAATMLAGMDEKSRRAMEEAEARRRGRGGDDDKTEIASSLRPQDHSPTGTWVLRENDATAELKGVNLKGVDADEMDLDLDRLEKALISDTVKQPRRGSAPEEQFSDDVFSASDDHTSTDIDLDIGEARRSHDREPTQTERIPASEMELPELEPVTMSEVGTKLDLARAYMDMGDPEGARSILDEVLSEGSPTQKQEAQRLIDSLPG